MSPRVLVVWCPDWPVVAALRLRDLPGHLPAAVFAANRAEAVNAAAREFGVRRGMRRRDAQSRCPELAVLDADPDRDAHAFEEVLAALEELRPGVAPLRPGLVALRSPGRFYGGEVEAGAVLAQCVVDVGIRDVRVGVADELFTAEQAARTAPVQESVVVPTGESGAFLRPLPVEAIDEPETVGLLRRLGLTTLGDLAGLPSSSVTGRLGQRAAWVHRVLHGGGARPLDTRTPPPELAVHVDFEPPLVDAEAVCFSTRRTAELFVAQLAERQLVCTDVVIQVDADHELASERRWLHPRWFTSTDLVDRLHWQLVGSRQVRPASGRGIHAPVTRVRLVPEQVVAESVHADGLWGGTDSRVERGIARVQGMLGPEAVVAPVLQGGRSPAERQAMVPWGTRATALRPRELPWPGSIPPPYPARVLAEPCPAVVVDPAGRPVVVGRRGTVSAPPARFRPGDCDPGEGWLAVAAWAGPWPVEELWWESGGGRRVARFQLVTADGRAWLVTFDDALAGWVTEAAYD
ncbi:DNA polymerase Y family protein [Nocardioides sp. CER19]|uniref:DNA polymerase Y family protein n=1 Tax=Nocardioides sp. CER19 TaxID=3038538 RepID=UPI00244750AF|nr:DNA polymerase Y family protein [Nocardioides sp. CER19]MDH2415488.1 DNA polymerase Y family protein [Nocardioides sp. CER19]